MRNTLSSLSKKSLHTTIEVHGVEVVIDFYLDCMNESKEIHPYWLQSLEYCRLKLLTDEFLKEPPF